ncbi:MAG: LamG-like jellyroll fold domain-containing protein, partial [Bacteroidota bacterium]
TIYFNLPGSGPWDITLVSALPNITGAGTIINATTQPLWDLPSANVPNIIGNAGINIGLNFTTNNVEVYGIRLSNFNIDGIRLNVVGSAADGYRFGDSMGGNIFTGNSNGIQILTYSGGGTIQGNYIGILPDGTTTSTANDTGILLGTLADNVQIGGLGLGDGNVITNNTDDGIRLSNADMAIIQGNNIGLNPLENNAFGSTNGIDLTTATGVTIEQNVISGHTIGIRVNNSSNNTFIRNNIGVASDGTTPYGNIDGITIIDNADSDNNIIGSSTTTSDGNIIAHSTGDGINIDGLGNNGNQIQRNTIFNNGALGIALVGGSHNGIGTPSIDPIATSTDVSGVGTNGDEIDLYLSDGAGQGQTYLGSATVAGGTWNVGTLSLVQGDQVVATSTNPADGTSEFSPQETYTIPYPAAEGAGEALTFDGLGNSVTFGAQVAAGLTDFSAEAWINPTSFTPGGVTTNDIRTILSEGDLSAGNTAFFIGFAGNGSSTDLTTFIDGGSGPLFVSVPASSIPLNEWTHVAMTWSSGSSEIRLYVNGVNVASNISAGSALVSSVDNFEIGGSANTEEDYFDGEIDEVKIWNFERTENAIRTDLARKIDPSDGGLVAYYRMDDGGDAANLRDATVNAIDGTINGAIYVGSGAPLGDASTFEYIYTAGSGRNLGDFHTQNLEVANLPLHIYQVNQTPNVNTATGFNTIDDLTYYGVFSPGQSFQARYAITGVTSDRRILSRGDFNDPTWVPASGFLGTEVQDNQIISAVGTGSGQFVTATQISPYPTELDGGSALSLDGVNDFVDLGSNAEFSGHQELTIEAWVNPDYTNIGDHGAIVSNLSPAAGGGGYQLSISNTNIRILYRDDTFVDRELVSGPLPAGEWSHIAGIIENSGPSNSNLYLYVNGVQVASSLGETGVPDYTGITNLFIGSNSDGVAGSTSANA